MFRAFCALMITLLLMVAPVAAQDVVADGLMNPRGMAFDSDGNLYVVENGSAGDVMIDAGRGRAPMTTGTGGQVTI